MSDFFIGMLLIRKLLIKISKSRGHRLENRPLTPINVKLSCYSNSPNVKFLSDRETNGCHISFPLYNKLSSMKYGYNMSQFPENVCWKCKEPLKLKNFCCASCGALQHPNSNLNYFQLLGVPQMYDINLEDLKKKFMNLQVSFHPDKFVNKSKEEQEISESYSAVINTAYAILKDPLQRGFYLLELQKIPTDNLSLKQDFLYDIMEKNEELEAIEQSKDLQRFSMKNKVNIDKHLDLVKKAFLRSQLDEVSINLIKLNYYVKLDNKVKEKLHKQSLDPSEVK